MKQHLTLAELIAATAPDELFEDMTYAQFLRLADPGRLHRSAHVRGPPLEVYGNSKREYHVFNFKSYPSTTGFRHKGYIAFKKPRSGKATPAEQLAVEVDCDCEDYRYRWAWANRQKGAGKIGPQSLNKCINRAPRFTNPSGKPALCKHLLAARHYILGLLAHFPAPKEGEPDVDISWKLDQLVKQTQQRYDNYAAAKEKAQQMTHRKNLVRNYRNVYGPMPAAEVPVMPDNQPVPLPPEEPGEPLPMQPPERKHEEPAKDLTAGTPPKPPETKPGQPQRKIRGEGRVVIMHNDNRMNTELLKKSKTILEEIGDEIEKGDTAPVDADLPSPADSDMPSDATPPIDGDAMDMPPAEAPEDEALNLLRDIASGITRLADELAPAGEPEELEEPEEPEEPEGEPEDLEGSEEPGSAVPPVEDEDEFGETMPVATGA